tara:strand:- start:14265 stop:14951 length:687 start_codon:yes stop_codon:yes gene_type:complete
MIRQALKSVFAKTVPDSEFLRFLAYRPNFDAWKCETLKVAGFRQFDTREQLYEYINADIIGDDAIDYLEFGVFRGSSIKHWAKTHSHPDSQLIGFDTFTGLPEEWKDGGRVVSSGHFDTAGAIPSVPDDRVRFVKGLFQESLPGFLDAFHRHGRLVIHNDSDLYSATLYVLAQLDRFLEPGDILIFDEFYSVMHEYRAFHDYSQSFARTLVPVAATKEFVQVAFQFTG